MIPLDIPETKEQACFPDLTIWLTRDAICNERGEWKLERVSSKNQSSSYDFRFNSPPDLKNVLSRELVMAIKEYLPINEGKFAFSTRDFLFEMEGAVLNEIYVIGMVTKAGIQRVSVKFRSFLGEASSLFIGKAGSVFANGFRCDLATRTVKDLLLPILNITSAYRTCGGNIKHLDAARIKDTLSSMLIKRQEIEFQLTLLQRFVRCCDEGVKPLNDYAACSVDGTGLNAIQYRSIDIAR